MHKIKLREELAEIPITKNYKYMGIEFNNNFKNKTHKLKLDKQIEENKDL